MRTKYGVRERSCRFDHRDGVANGIFYTVWYARPTLGRDGFGREADSVGDVRHEEAGRDPPGQVDRL